jgi:hypothetical protein
MRVMSKDRELMHSPIDAVWDWSYLIGQATSGIKLFSDTGVLEQFERTGDVAAS